MMESRTLSPDEMAAIMRRFGMHNMDEATVARALELNTGLLKDLARLPGDHGKDLEPAHVFSPPLR